MEQNLLGNIFYSRMSHQRQTNISSKLKGLPQVVNLKI